MKKITRSILVAFFVCGGILTASAQSDEQIEYMKRNSDSQAALELQDQLNNKYQENHKKALELAAQNGWPITINKPDGGFSELQGVTPDGHPLYYTTSNHGSAITSRVNKIQPGGGDNLNLDGTGMRAGVWDGGKPLTTHVDLLDETGANRLISVNDNTSVVALLDHSTHVMGTILSSGVNDSKARGMAYKATGLYADWNNDLTEMQTAVNNYKLLVSNHSYGLEAGKVGIQKFGSYDTSAHDVDNLLFTNPFYQPCWAAGNDRAQYSQYQPSKGGHDLLTAEACSKNVLVVAAVNEVLTYTNASSVVMSVFSNWGPTDDYRIKPDISDKGVQVYSTWYDASDPTTSSTYNRHYTAIDGTSMATPGVTGSLTLLQQHWGNLNPSTVMRSATLRGLVAHTADEAGSYPGPDSKFGWGLINAERAALTISAAAANTTAAINESTLADKQVYTTTVNASGTQPLVVTLSWTDRPGTINETGTDVTTPVLVNDLDITVTGNGKTYYPWKLVVGPTNLDVAAVQGINSRDNIEKVEVGNTTPGTYTITVAQKAGTTLAGTKQDYSLIVTGLGSPLGVEQNDFKVFDVWPNPANDELNVSMESDLSAEALLTIYDIQGRRVVDQKLDGADTMFTGTVNISSLNSGIYLVKITQGDKQSVRKIVKK